MREISVAFAIRWWVAFFISLVIVVLVTLPPFLPVEWRELLMFSFANVCHQIPDRSPFINEIQLAVCHRCYGVYAGLPLAVLGYLFMHRLPIKKTVLRNVLFGSLVIVFIDWIAPMIGLWHNTAFSRMATGLGFGLVAGIYLAQVLTEQTNPHKKSTEPASEDDF